MTAPGPLDLIRSDRARRLALVATCVAQTATASRAAAGAAPRAPTRATACGVFTLADVTTLIGRRAKADSSQSHAVDLAGRRNTAYAHSAGADGLADLQTLIPPSAPRGQQPKLALEGDRRTEQGTAAKALGAAAFRKSKVGAAAIHVLTAGDIVFNVGATTNGTNSASQAKLGQVAGPIVKALG